LSDNQRWKYDELSPGQLLEKLKLDEGPAEKDELARAEFFWRRRPRLLPAIGYIESWDAGPKGRNSTSTGRIC
jgi:hypothetical protein